MRCPAVASFGILERQAWRESSVAPAAKALPGVVATGFADGGDTFSAAGAGDVKETAKRIKAPARRIRL